jgi:hypothetical protein
MPREITAFVVAALAVPLLLVAAFPSGKPNDVGYAVTIAISAVVSFIVVLCLGLPIYLFLQRKKWTAFWIAPLAGFIVAAVAWHILSFLLILMFGLGLSYALSWLIEIGSLRGILWPIGPIGAGVGVLVWLIARPDRISR